MKTFRTIPILFAALALFVCTLASGAFAAPTVSNVAFVQQSDGAGDTEVVVTYDLLTPDGPSTVTLRVSTDGGATFPLLAVSVAGDVGPGVTTGTLKTIAWAVAGDLPDVDLPNATVRVLAEDGQPIPLSISSTLPENSVTQTATQTFTFTFGEAVTGFDVSDITVTGATKNNFATVSGSVYTLDVTGTGGTVTASVAPGAATSVASGTTTLGDSFANFYQDTWTVELQATPLVTMDLIRIPAGTFVMGSPEDELSRSTNETQHEVILTQDFYLGKTQVTQNQWVALQSFPQAQTYVGGTMPVHNVSHNDIGSWMTALNAHVTEPGTFTLPTESQWEYAARAGTTTRFNYGNGFGADESCSAEAERTNNMWYCGNNVPSGTKIVGQKPANAWGLRDMHGNVWEWCSDWYDATYPTGPVVDPTGPGTGSYRVVRGGSWGSLAHFCRSAQRGVVGPSGRSYDGFRVLAVR